MKLSEVVILSVCLVLATVHIMPTRACDEERENLRGKLKARMELLEEKLADSEEVMEQTYDRDMYEEVKEQTYDRDMYEEVKEQTYDRDMYEEVKEQTYDRDMYEGERDELNAETIKEEMAEVMEEYENELAIMQPKKKKGAKKLKNKQNQANQIKNNIKKYKQKPKPPPRPPPVSVCYGHFPVKTLENVIKSITLSDHVASYSYIGPNSNVGRCSNAFFESGTPLQCKHGGCQHGNRRNKHDSEKKLLDECDGITEYWSTWTPCIDCVKDIVQYMIKHRRNNPNFELTIHVGKPYYDYKYDVNLPLHNHVSTEERHMYCLGYLMDHGVKLRAWNWNTFKQVLASNGNVPIGTKCQKTFNKIKDKENKRMGKLIKEARYKTREILTKNLRKLCTGK